MRYLLLLFTVFIYIDLYADNVTANKRPNIIVILADDMGFSDIGCYGSEIPTPNIDSLAANGLRFRQFYNTGRCCPTRASILTGLYSHQAGVGGMMNDEKLPGYRGQLNENCVTIGEVLKQSGYFTAVSGKWHVGQEHGVTPWNRGFDRSFNAPSGGFYYPGHTKANLFLNGKDVSNDGTLPKDWYITDLWTDYGLSFIKEAKEQQKPFFLYLAHIAPHFPLQAPQEEIAKFRGKYKMGWDKLREMRYAKQIQTGLIDTSWQLSEVPKIVGDWESQSDQEKDKFDQIMSIYAATITILDRSIGRLVENLKQQNELDNTLIIFLSDNGANAESGVKGKLIGDVPGDGKSVVYQGQSWATLSNTPFRYYKHYNHEGGISSPFIVHWPAKIKESGALRNQIGHVIDLMPTCVDVANATYPKTFNGKNILPMEGKSLIPIFENKEIERGDLFWEHEGNAAVRSGDYKLVRSGRSGEWELYNVAEDRTELKNLTNEKPELAKELAAKWEKWADKCNVKKSTKKGK